MEDFMKKILYVCAAVLIVGLLSSLLVGCDNASDDVSAGSAGIESVTTVDETWGSSLLAEFEALMDTEGWERDPEFDVVNGGQYIKGSAQATFVGTPANFNPEEVISDLQEMVDASERVGEFEYGIEDSWFWVWSTTDADYYAATVYDRNVAITFVAPKEDRQEMDRLLHELGYRF